MRLETIDRYLREIARQLTIARPNDGNTKHDAAHGVNRIELRSLRSKLRRQRLFRLGHEDRIAGRGAVSNDGAYLDGYYSGDGRMYYVTWSDLERVRFGRRTLHGE